MNQPRVVASVPADAVEHLFDLVLAEHLRLDVHERSWLVVRDGALERLHDEADLGVERSARTLAALVQASFDVEFVGIVAGLGEDGP